MHSWRQQSLAAERAGKHVKQELATIKSQQRSRAGDGQELACDVCKYNIDLVRLTLLPLWLLLTAHRTQPQDTATDARS